MNDPNNEADKQSWARRMIASPWIGLAGLIIGVLGIAIGVGIPLGLHCAAQTERELVYAVNPIRTKVVTAGQSSALDVYHNNERLGDVDVTAVQIAIWNRGEESIWQENILEDIVIVSNPDVPILEASIAKRSRDVTEFTVVSAPETLANGTIGVSWRILEKDDGASVQLIYVGSDDVAFCVDGAIEGIREVRLVEPDVRVKTPEEQIESERRVRGGLLVSAGVLGGMLVLLVAWKLALALFRRRLSFDWTDALFAAPLAIGIGVIIWQYLSKAPTGPPFGF